MLKDQMEHIYRNTPAEKIPWNIETPPKILLEFLNSGLVKPCKSLELGCGAGNYVIYLAKLGFQASGVDFSEAAIEMARQSAKEKSLECSFIVADVIGDLSEVEEVFDFVYDWELLHHIFPDSRKQYLANVNRLLSKNGRYLSVFFSEDSPQFGGKGKYRKTPLETELYFSSEDEMIALYEPLFEIGKLKTEEVEGKYAPHKAIHAVLKKR